jgi:hypothetical protein
MVMADPAKQADLLSCEIRLFGSRAITCNVLWGWAVVSDICGVSYMQRKSLWHVCLKITKLWLQAHSCE